MEMKKMGKPHPMPMPPTDLRHHRGASKRMQQMLKDKDQANPLTRSGDKLVRLR